VRYARTKSGVYVDLGGRHHTLTRHGRPSARSQRLRQSRRAHNRRAGFDFIDASARQGPRNRQFFGACEGDPGACSPSRSVVSLTKMRVCSMFTARLTRKRA